MLAQVYGQVRDPPAVRLVVAQRPGPERTAHPLHDLGGRRLDERPHPQGPQTAAVLAVAGVGVDFPGRRLQRGPGGVQRDVDRAEMGQPVRADVTSGRGGQQRPADATRPAVPARGDTGAAVREAWPVDVAAGLADRRGRDVHEADVQGVTGRHAGRRPRAGNRGKIACADREEPVAVRRRRGHQRMGARAGPGAVLLSAVQAPAAAGLAGVQSRAGRLRGPDTPAASGRWRGGVELSQDGQRIGVSLGEPGQGEIFPGQVRESRPALAGPAAAGQRQVQPARLDRGGESRGGRGACPACTAALTIQRVRGQQMSGFDHFHPLMTEHRCPSPGQANTRVRR